MRSAFYSGVAAASRRGVCRTLSETLKPRFRKALNGCVAAAALLAACLLTGCPTAAPFIATAGADLYAEDPDSSKGKDVGQPQVQIEVSILDLGPAPIPADFFDPGSEPFSGVIELEGTPLVNSPICGTNLGNTDTIIQRKGNALLPTIGSSDMVPVELLQLLLKSRQPITVTYGGTQSEQWNVILGLQPNAPSLGSMTITRTTADSGTFDSMIDVKSMIDFIRIPDGKKCTQLMNHQLIGDDHEWSDEVRDPPLPEGCATNITPGLSKLPILGNLFRQRLKHESDTLVVFITPSIIND